MRKLIEYLRWLLNDGEYIIIAGKNCGCCGKWYEVKLAIPSYMYGPWHRWGLCEECASGKIISRNEYK